MTGPHLPPLRTRAEFFELCIADAVEYVEALWPEELRGVRFEIASGPVGEVGDHVDRWATDPRRRLIVLYRLPIQRLTHLHRDDDWHRRSLIESCVFRAVAELLGKDPWEIAPERYRHF